MPQEFVHGHGGHEDEETPDLSAPSSGSGQAQVQGVDSLLDEIDTVLEDNAEAFVKSFVQKGGQ